jgi:hypothetical protein
MLHPGYATPYNTVILLSIVSAIIGAAGIIGGLPILMGIVLASNLGAFLLYSLLCVLTVATFVGDPAFNFFRHVLFPVLGLFVNAGLIAAAGLIGLRAGGVITQASMVAFGLAALWLLLNSVYYIFRRKSANT